VRRKRLPCGPALSGAKNLLDRGNSGNAGDAIRIIGELVKSFATQRRITKRACVDYAYTEDKVPAL